MALIKNTPPEFFDKTIELMDQHFRDENYSEKAIYYDLAARCVDKVWQESLEGRVARLRDAWTEFKTSLLESWPGRQLIRFSGFLARIIERGSK
jgi:hypothetical protein